MEKKPNPFALSNEFNGVFYFTNATKEDFTALWNNKEYVFPKGTSCPIIISDETLENIQEIRKKFAYKLAVREFYNTKVYRDMAKAGRGLPPTYDDKILQPWIDQCLSPLPVARVTVKAGKKQDESAFSENSRPVDEKDSLTEVFKDVVPEKKGAMPNTPIN